MEERARKIAELLKVLANENRLMVICALMEGSMTVGKIAERVPNITQPALSQHLSVLKLNGVLDYQKTGANVIYSIADQRVTEIIKVLRQYYCDDGAEI